MSAGLGYGLTVGDIVACAARVKPDGIAATLDGEAVTFREVEEEGNRTANALRGLGARRGDRIVWWAGTSLRAMSVFAGMAKAGAVLAPLNPNFNLKEAARAATYLKPRLIVSDAEHAPEGEVLAKDLGVDLAVTGVGEAPTPGVNLDAATAGAASTEPDDGPVETDQHIIFLTSGSTGDPKGVMISHRCNWLRTFDGTVAAVGGGGLVLMFPLFHMAGWSYILEQWHRRGAAHLVHRADPAVLIHEVEKWRAERLYCIPAVWTRVLDEADARGDLSSLRNADSGTSACPRELLERIKQRLPHTMTTVYYGSTEANSVAALPDQDLFRKVGSVGPTVPGIETRILDSGELCVRGPTLMDGYFERPKETAEALRDGWYHTGDLADIDDEGYLTIIGRARELIRTGGEWVAPVEVEQELRDLPGLAEVAVIGLPDDDWGELVCAAVVMADGANADVDTIRAHLAPRLASYKHPRRVIPLDELPHTPATGQIQRTLLRERLTLNT